MRQPVAVATILAVLALGPGAAALRGPGGSVRAQDAPPKAPPKEPPDPAEGVGDIVEEILDQVIEQGVAPPRIAWDDPLLSRRIVLLFGEVNRNSSHDVVAKLLHLGEGTAPIDLFVRSDGGFADDAFAICDAMRTLRAPVNTWATGACDSAGALIVAGGTGTRRALPHALLSLHFNLDEGDAAWSRERANRIRVEEFWRGQAELPPEFFPVTADRQFFLSAGEALRLKVVDEIVDLHPRAKEAKAPEKK